MRGKRRDEFYDFLEASLSKHLRNWKLSEAKGLPIQRTYGRGPALRGNPDGFPCELWAIPEPQMLIRMGRMTAVIPFQRSSCWMAKAVSLCIRRWMMLGWRKTDCPAKTVDRVNSLHTDSTSCGRRLDDVRSQVAAIIGGEAQLAGQVDVFLQGSRGRSFHAPDRLGSLERSDVHFGHRHEDEILVEPGKAPDDGQEGMDAESVVSVDELDGGHLLRIDGRGVDRALGRKGRQQLVELADAAPDLVVVALRSGSTDR